MIFKQTVRDIVNVEVGLHAPGEIIDPYPDEIQ
jgi:hypothetical protein